MEGNSTLKYGHSLQRQLSTLKLASRLLSHELHSQSGAKSITLSRDTVFEIQTTIDLFIEEANRRVGQSGSSAALPAATGETQLVPARN